MSAPALHSLLPLAEWGSFYVLVGTSAAALTGLTFVVITLSGGSGDRMDSALARLAGLRAFVTPTAVHFGAALWISALLCMPGHTVLSIALCLGITGAAGIAYCARVLHWMLVIRAEYRPFLADWVWTVGFPPLAYLALLAAAAIVTRDPPPGLYLVAGAALLLLVVGIHNAWDVVVWFTTERHAHPARARRALRAGRESSEPEARGRSGR